MPEIKLQHVVSFSSEDRNFAAENLLKGDSFKKWKGASIGSKQETITLQLERAEKIQQVDVGNESSAFIEVLVGRSSSKDDDFKVLLVASTFMNPLESRNGSNASRVRIFSLEKLNKAVSEEKWDRVKVVCTQPFNRNVQYGLTFIRLHSPPSDDEKKVAAASTSSAATLSSEKKSSFGAFGIKANSGKDEIKAGMLFANKQKEKTSPVPLTGAAAVRAASKVAEEIRSKKEESNLAVKRTIKPDSDHEASKPSTSRPPMKRLSTSLSSVASSASESKAPLKRTQTEPPKPSKEKVFNKLLKGVVFVMSGFQNPKRSDLRDAATEMGAKYKPDWGRDCTHLICAFEKTPKYNQVKGKGRIVKDSWITGCYEKRRKLPWRNYRLGRARTPDGSSEEEEEEEEEIEDDQEEYAPPKKQTRGVVKRPIIEDDDDDSDSPNTEDELRKIDEREAAAAKKDEKSVYDESTDEGDGVDDEQRNGSHDSTSDDGEDLPELPNFFDSKHFFMYGDFEASERNNLRRCIVAYGGEIDEYMSGETNYVISNSLWDDNFDDALNDNVNLAFVKPPWIFMCDEKQKIIPHQKYVIVPK